MTDNPLAGKGRYMKKGKDESLVLRGQYYYRMMKIDMIIPIMVGLGMALTANAAVFSGDLTVNDDVRKTTPSDAEAALLTSDIDAVLAAVSANNPELSALQQDAEALSMQMKSENILEDPTIEYSSFYSAGVSGQSGSELVVSQGFDFPTLYSARHRKNELSRAALASGLDSDRRRILLDAKTLCIDIIMYRQLGELLAMQSDIASELLDLYNRRLASGDASALEVNKIKMELMSVATAVAANSAALDAASRSLVALNGGRPIVFEAVDFPVTASVPDAESAVNEYLASDASIISATNAAEAARKEISINKQGWIPKLEIGYRRNTAIRDAEHGFLVGCSIPLYSNHKKVSMAKSRATSAQSTLNYAKLKAEAEVRSILNEMQQTEAAIAAYNEPLMRETLTLLRQAVEGGEISLIDYFVEASGIYDSLSACISLQASYGKLAARLFKNRL